MSYSRTRNMPISINLQSHEDGRFATNSFSNADQSITSIGIMYLFISLPIAVFREGLMLFLFLLQSY